MVTIRTDCCNPTLSPSLFRPRSIITCFFNVSRHKHFLPNDINWLVYPIEAHCVLCEVWTEFFFTYNLECQSSELVPRPQRSLAGLWTHQHGSESGPFVVGFMVDKVELGLVFSGYFGFTLSVSFHSYSMVLLIFKATRNREQIWEAIGRSEKKWRCLGNQGFYRKKHTFVAFYSCSSKNLGNNY